MAYSPIHTGIQYEDSNGNPYSGAVLKCYKSDGTTNIQMATDSTGGTLVNTIKLNAAGNPVVSDNFVFPHIDQIYRVALYPTQSAADSNTGQIWITSALTPAGIGPSQVDSVEIFTNLRTYTGAATLLQVKGGVAAGDGLGGTFYKLTGAGAGTYVDNGDTVIIPSGGDGSEGWLKQPERHPHIAAGTGAAYTVPTLLPVLATGRVYKIKLNVPNTGACTIKPSTGTPVNVKLRDATDPLSGQLLAGVYNFEYNGANLIALTNREYSEYTAPHIAAGTGAAYTVSTLPSTLTTNRVYSVLINVANTGACTLAPGGGTARNIKLQSGSDPEANQLLNKVYSFWDDGTNLVVISPEIIEGSFTGTLTGVGATVTDTIEYKIIGDSVTIYVPTMVGTSNSTTMTVTGLPALITPSGALSFQYFVVNGEDNTARSFMTCRAVSSNLLSFEKLDFSVFTATGGKGFQGFTYTYLKS
jgi:hypothetical protein